MKSGKPLRDFRTYGRLEAFNALLIPAIATYYGWPGDAAGGVVLTLANLAVVIGLVVGAVYWLALAARLKGDPAPTRRALILADRAPRPLLAVVVLSVIADTWLIAARGFTLPTGIAATVTLLAALEYVNYYHVQLQHFDNLADWRKLLHGRGFRRAHMAGDLAAWRLGRRVTRPPATSPPSL